MGAAAGVLAIIPGGYLVLPKRPANTNNQMNPNTTIQKQQQKICLSLRGSLQLRREKELEIAMLAAVSGCHSHSRAVETVFNYQLKGNLLPKGEKVAVLVGCLCIASVVLEAEQHLAFFILWMFCSI